MTAAPVPGTLTVTLLSDGSDEASGWGRLTDEVCTRLAGRDDVQVRLLVPRGAGTNRLDSRIQVDPVLPPWTGTFRRSPRRRREFLRVPPATGAANLYHALVEFPYGISAWRLGVQRKTPYIISTQGTYGVAPLERLFDASAYRRALRSAAAITAPSTFTARELRRRCKRLAAVEILTNGVDARAFSTPASERPRARFGLPEYAPVVLGVGALKRRKGIDTLIRAFATVLRAVPEALLVVAGRGDQRALRSLAADLGAAESVRFVGAVSDDALRDLYHACDIFALLPRNDRSNFEGFGLVYLEAGAAGKPVIGTWSGGVPDAVEHGTSGLLVPELAAEDAAAAVLRLLGDGRLRDRMGRAGRTKAETHDWSHYVDRLVELYRSVVLPREGAAD